MRVFRSLNYEDFITWSAELMARWEHAVRQTVAP
jgi:hypothetical protein